VIVDDSIFRLAGDPPGFRRFRSTQPFRAGVSGLSFNANVVQVTVAPAPSEGRGPVVNISPPSDYFRVIRRVRNSRRRTRLHVASFRRGTRRTGVTVSGWIHRNARTRRYWRRVHHPALYAGHTLVELLKSAGITVRRSAVRRGRVPATAIALASHRSPSLSRIVRRATKYSSNVKAEMLLLSLGAAVFGHPGTYAKGRRAVAQFMRGLGIDPTSYRLENGSGLSHRSSIRARDLVRVLTRLQADFALGPEFLAALPLAGHDGTLRRVYEGSPAAGHVRAKTGTLNRTTCMSGYVSWGGRTLVFSLMSARVRHRGWARKQHVAMTEALLSYLKRSTASRGQDVGRRRSPPVRPHADLAGAGSEDPPGAPPEGASLDTDPSGA
jgi:D-alanyl-D-alanine carboxypeptidase/D-alanyl-D-alanine-endopeptidase (penicillin-binding protein 4)